MNIIICGDIHYKWTKLNELIHKESPDIILQVGDFGWWPHFDGKPGLLPKGKLFKQDGIKNPNTEIFWLPGNHENWDDLYKYGYTITELLPKINYCPFGTTITLPTKETVLFCGGASSIDRMNRIEGVDWWHQEEISYGDLYNLPDIDIDIVLSHTIPTSFAKKVGWYLEHDFNGIYKDFSVKALELVFEKYKPKKWFSGHFHKFETAIIDNCEWTSLSHADNGKWWINL